MLLIIQQISDLSHLWYNRNMKKYYIGYVFNNGNVIVDGPKSISQPLGGHDTLWLIKCVCGNERWTYTNSVRKSVYPCKLCYNNSMKINNELPAIKKSFRSLRGNAKSRGIPVEISLDYFIKLSSNNCYWCGSKPLSKKGLKDWHKNATINGIDRINNTLGYTIENCVACCYDCNRMKSNLTEVNFLEHIKKIYDWSINA